VVTGYSIPDFRLTDVECDALINAVSNVTRSRAGARHLMGNPAVAALASDSRLVAAARCMLGSAQAVPFRATLFEKSGKGNWLVAWHQDTALPLASRFDAADWGPWSEKAGIIYAHAPASALARIVALRVHLDASTLDNGPLRVIPGSHAAGVLTDERVRDYVKTHSAIDCPVPRGGVLAMRPLIVHSSSKAMIDQPRRVLHIEYSGSLELALGIRLAIA